MPDTQQAFRKCLLNEVPLKLINLPAAQFSFSGKIIKHLAEVRIDKRKTLMFNRGSHKMTAIVSVKLSLQTSTGNEAEWGEQK